MILVLQDCTVIHVYSIFPAEDLKWQTFKLYHSSLQYIWHATHRRCKINYRCHSYSLIIPTLSYYYPAAPKKTLSCLATSSVSSVIRTIPLRSLNSPNFILHSLRLLPSLRCLELLQVLRWLPLHHRYQYRPYAHTNHDIRHRYEPDGCAFFRNCSLSGRVIQVTKKPILRHAPIWRCRNLCNNNGAHTTFVERWIPNKFIDSAGQKRTKILRNGAYCSLCWPFVRTENERDVASFGAKVRTFTRCYQQDYWLPHIDSRKRFECFAFTKPWHGRNVCGMETLARYDSNTDEFMIDVPTKAAQKYRFGGVGQSATVSVVSAKLILSETDHRNHVFLVHLRDENGQFLPEIRVADCEVYSGLNAIDHECIRIATHRVRRSVMLTTSRCATENSQFQANVSSTDAHFGAVLAALTWNCIHIAHEAITCTCLRLKIAMRYSFQRRTFKTIFKYEVGFN